MVYIFGGQDSEKWVNTFESFDFRSNKWNEEDVKPLPMPRNGTRTQASLLKCQRRLLNAQLIEGLHPEHYLKHTVSVFTFFQKNNYF